MLIIGKNIRNQTTKKWIAYDGKAGLDPLTGLPDGQRPELMRTRAIGVELREISGSAKQLFFGRYNMEELVNSGNGASRWLATRAIMNKI